MPGPVEHEGKSTKARVRGVDRFLGLLRASALVAMAVTVAGSIGSVLYAGSRNPSSKLLFLFAVWVSSPVVGLAFASVVARRWSVVSRATLQGVILIFTLVTLGIYGAAALGPPKTRAAFMFIIVPPVSWLVLAAVVPLVELIAGRLFHARVDRRMLKDFAGFTGIGIVGIGVLMGSLWLEHRSNLSLPTPTGSSAVGRTVQVWTDDAPAETPPTASRTKRELLVWIWYPASRGQSVVFDDYVPAQLRARGPPGRVSIGSRIFDLLTRDLSKVHSHSIANAELSSQEQAYPVVIIRTGASLGVLTYSTLAEDLASHGYVVVGFDAPGRTAHVVFPDDRVVERTPENNPELYAGQPHDERLGRLLAAWTADIGFVLDRLERLNAANPAGKFAGRLDMTRVGVFGHSFGGAQAAQFCAEDSRCKAGIDVDGRPLGSVVQTGLKQPFMFLLSSHNPSDTESGQIEADIKSIYDRLPADARLRVVIRGASHFTFNDDGALFKSQAMRGLLRVLGNLRISGRRQLAITAYCVHSFFDVYLKGEGVSRPRIASPLYPEIQVLE